MDNKAKISTGPNARPRNESIAQTAEGIPDDAERRDKPAARAPDRGKAEGPAQPRKYKGRDLPGAAGYASAGAEEDTYD